MALLELQLRNRAPRFVMGWYTKGTDMPTKPEGRYYYSTNYLRWKQYKSTHPTWVRHVFHPCLFLACCTRMLIAGYSSVLGLVVSPSPDYRAWVVSPGLPKRVSLNRLRSARSAIIPIQVFPVLNAYTNSFDTLMIFFKKSLPPLVGNLINNYHTNFSTDRDNR